MRKDPTMSERDPNTETLPEAPQRANVRDVESARTGPIDPDQGGIEDSPGMPGGTLGTGGAREQDR